MRAAGLAPADVDAALAPGGPLVIGWLLRGTLHLVRVEDYPWLLGLTAPGREAGSRRRLGQLGVVPDDAGRAVTVIERALADGPRTRAELGERLAAAGIPTAGQALPHLLARAALRGVSVAVGERVYALARDVLGAAPDPALTGHERDRALAELARRYLRGHAPATAEDLARWSGLALREARAAMSAAGDAALARHPERIPTRRLPAFDPYMLGWADRSFAVPAALAREVHPGGGIIRPVVIEDGLVTGTWRGRA